MTFRVAPLTALIASGKNEEAAEILRAKIAKCGTIAAAARDLDVDYRTMTRWLKTLSERGHDVRADLDATGETPRSKFRGKTPDEQRDVLRAVAKETRGNLALAARKLGCTSQALYKRVSRLGLDDEISAMRGGSQA